MSQHKAEFKPVTGNKGIDIFIGFLGSLFFMIIYICIGNSLFTNIFLTSNMWFSSLLIVFFLILIFSLLISEKLYLSFGAIIGLIVYLFVFFVVSAFSNTPWM
jgi:hypothetical protein